MLDSYLTTDRKNTAWSGLRKYAQTTNSDGTVSFEDKTTYTEKGTLSADDVNLICKFANAIHMDINEQGNNVESLTLNSAFTVYNSDSKVEIERAGIMRDIRGTIKPTSQIAAGGTATITTLKAKDCPPYRLTQVCQGSGLNKWLLTIETNGQVTFSRYGTSSNISCPTNAWLIFHVMYFATNSEE